MGDNHERLVCPGCRAVNRLPAARLGDRPVCGKCRAALLGQPVEVGGEELEHHLDKTSLPVIVDFWAPWCAPCQQFAPVFQGGAAQFAASVRFVKVDTQANQAAAARHTIRSIPTLALFHRGREVSRLSGALTAAQFSSWLHGQLAGLRG